MAPTVRTRPCDELTSSVEDLIASCDGDVCMTMIYLDSTAEAAHERTQQRDRCAEEDALGLDVLVGRPLAEILPELQVPPDVAAALLGEGTAIGEVLALGRAHERGDWDELALRAGGLSVAEPAVASSWMDALTWADEAFDDGSS